VSFVSLLKKEAHRGIDRDTALQVGANGVILTKAARCARGESANFFFPHRTPPTLISAEFKGVLYPLGVIRPRLTRW
jgi:hypothetical protein